MTNSRNQISQFRKTLKTLMHSDTIALRRQLDHLLRSRNRLAEEAFAKRLAGLESHLQAAAERKRRRGEGVPRFDDLPHLPITDAKNAIIDSLVSHPVTIISGETGSGKTTQIPKFCLAAGRGIFGKIACTNPGALPPPPWRPASPKNWARRWAGRWAIRSASRIRPIRMPTSRW